MKIIAIILVASLIIYYDDIIIRLALVIHFYSKFGTHIIIATSLVINCQRHNFLQFNRAIFNPVYY